MTWAVIIGATVALVIYDASVRIKYGSQATISVNIYNASKRYPLLPFAFGVLMGHFFWRMDL